MKKLAVFVSGGGTDFQSIIDGVANKQIDAEIALCVASKQGIYAIERARKNGIPCKVFDKTNYPTADAMFDEIAILLDSLGIDLVVLAGYLTILSPSFVAKYKGKIINIHPSLIPKFCGDGYYGMRVHQAVIAAGETYSGATIHYVDEGIDTGDIILQQRVAVLPTDTPETLAARVLELEHKMLPEALQMLCSGPQNPIIERNKMKRALLSVSDKTGIVEFAKQLEALNYEIVSTGGTFAALQKAGVKVVNISDITGFKECLDGRVKTLHPVVHAGILAKRDDPLHMAQIAELGITPIDVVAINLYPFKATVERPNATLEEAIENIDIGGPTMLRSAAKNYQDVYVVCDTADYNLVIDELKSGTPSKDTRFRLMYKVFQHTAVYDTLISTYLRGKLGIDFPDQITLAYDKKQDLRYGENPQQKAAFYKECFAYPGSLAEAVQLMGKELSYNNINDTNGALDLLREFSEPAVVAVKHANPCGVGIADNPLAAYLAAHNADPVSIFGGIVAVNRKVDAACAAEMVKTFLEIVIAPDFDDEAVAVFADKRKNARLLKLESINAPIKPGTLDTKKVVGGLLVQDFDCSLYDESDFRVVTDKQPTPEQIKAMIFGYKVVKHTKSNAIVVSDAVSTLGVGMGQTNRIQAAELALSHAAEKAQGAVLASDAFFPFPDCVQEAAKYGIAAIIQPGGSVNDQLSIDACNKAGIAMVFCGRRHFKH